MEKIIDYIQNTKEVCLDTKIIGSYYRQPSHVFSFNGIDSFLLQLINKNSYIGNTQNIKYIIRLIGINEQISSGSSSKINEITKCVILNRKKENRPSELQVGKTYYIDIEKKGEIKSLPRVFEMESNAGFIFTNEKNSYEYIPKSRIYSEPVKLKHKKISKYQYKGQVYRVVGIDVPDYHLKEEIVYKHGNLKENKTFIAVPAIIKISNIKTKITEVNSGEFSSFNGMDSSSTAREIPCKLFLRLMDNESLIIYVYFDQFPDENGIFSKINALFEFLKCAGREKKIQKNNAKKNKYNIEELL